MRIENDTEHAFAHTSFNTIIPALVRRGTNETIIKSVEYILTIREAKANRNTRNRIIPAEKHQKSLER